MKFTDWLKESYIQFYNKRYIQIPIIHNNDKNEINEVLKYLKIIVDQGFTKVNVSFKDKNRKFLDSINIKRDKNDYFYINHFASFVLKSLNVSDFYKMSIEKSNIAYVFKICDYDKRLNVKLADINKNHLYVKFAFVYKISKKDKEFMKLNNNIAIKSASLAPDKYNSVLLDTEKTIIDVISIHDSTK